MKKSFLEPWRSRPVLEEIPGVLPQVALQDIDANRVSSILLLRDPCEKDSERPYHHHI